MRFITFFLFIFLCVGCTVSPQTEVPDTTSLYATAIKSYVKISIVVEMSICSKDSGCSVIFQDPIASGSGFVFHDSFSDSHSYLLTASHVCGVVTPSLSIKTPMVDSEEILVEERLLIGHYNERKLQLQIIKNEPSSDLCLIQLENEKIQGLKLSDRDPVPGEKVYSMSSPQGLFYPKVVPFYEGFYLGKNATGNNLFLREVYQLFGLPGSSGSPILNSTGEVIGVLNSIDRRSDHSVSYSCPREEIKDFTKSSD